jgi:hypothetical protein
MMARLSHIRCAGAATALLAGSMIAFGAGPTSARSCTVDVDELMLIRKEVLDIVKGNVGIDAERADAAKRKYGDALKGGAITVDPNDFKGIFSLKGKPSPAMVKDLLTRLQNMIASCQ